jgi:hypothetical protein
MPTAQQLQLSPLAQFTSTGNLTPAEMEAALAEPSAYNNENISQVPIATMQQALAQEQQIASSNGMTPQEQAAIAQAEEAANTNTAGQRGAIAQDFAGRGVPQALIAAALQNQNAGQNAETMNMNALTAQANAANNGLTALNNEGNLASTLYGEEAGQANTVAAAQNALSQFNAANTQQANATNAANKQAANVYNTSNAQNISNQNVEGEQTAQEQNEVAAPQEAAQLALEKSGQQVAVNEAQANQQTAQGQQNAALTGSVIGAVGSAIAAADGGEIPPAPVVPATAFLRGGPVPGRAPMPGNNPANDVVPAKLSPGEFVVPRTAMANPAVRDFLAKNVPTPRPPSQAPHSSDIAALMKAMTMLRSGAA